MNKTEEDKPKQKNTLMRDLLDILLFVIILGFIIDNTTHKRQIDINEYKNCVIISKRDNIIEGENFDIYTSTGVKNVRVYGIVFNKYKVGQIIH